MHTLPIIKKNISLWVAYALLFLFVYTATSKILTWETFNETLRRSPLIGKKLAATAAILIPLIEFIISVLLFFQATRLTGLVCAMLLLAVFTVYIGYMVLYIPHLPCSCGGVLKQLSWRQHILFNAACLLLSIIGIVYDLKNYGQKFIDNNASRQNYITDLK